LPSPLMRRDDQVKISEISPIPGGSFFLFLFHPIVRTCFPPLFFVFNLATSGISTIALLILCSMNRLVLTGICLHFSLHPRFHSRFFSGRSPLSPIFPVKSSSAGLTIMTSFIMVPPTFFYPSRCQFFRPFSTRCLRLPSFYYVLKKPLFFSLFLPTEGICLFAFSNLITPFQSNPPTFVASPPRMRGLQTLVETLFGA